MYKNSRLESQASDQPCVVPFEYRLQAERKLNFLFWHLLLHAEPTFFRHLLEQTGDIPET